MNVLLITLGPHESNFSDIVEALQGLKILDQGQILSINEEDTFVCAFTLCYLEDMPQQNENAEFKTQ